MFYFLSAWFSFLFISFCTIIVLHHLKIYVQKQNLTEQTCSICIEPVKNIPLICGHAFHDECVLEWFKNNNTCPNCRHIIMDLNRGLV